MSTTQTTPFASVLAYFKNNYDSNVSIEAQLKAAAATVPGVEWDDAHRDSLLREFLRGTLPSRQVVENQRRPLPGLGLLEIEPRPSFYVRPAPPWQAVSGCVSRDPNRGALQYVYRDAERRQAVGSDGKCLTIVHDPRVKKSRAVSPVDGSTAAGVVFPQYWHCLPRPSITTHTYGPWQSADGLAALLSGASRVGNFFTAPYSDCGRGCLVVRVVFGFDQWLTADPVLLGKVLGALRGAGASRVRLGAVDARRPLVIQAFESLNWGVVMPLWVGDGPGAKSHIQIDLTA